MDVAATLSALVVPAVAVAGSLIGILVAVDQITGFSKARRHAEWASSAAVDSDSERRKSVLQHIALEHEARAVALMLVPGRVFIWPVAIAGMILAAALTAPRAQIGPWLIVILVLTVALGTLPSLARGFSAYFERERIRLDYARESESQWIYPHISSNQLRRLGCGSSHRLRDYSLSGFLNLGLIALGFGAGRVLAGEGSAWASWLLIGGYVITISTTLGARSLAEGNRDLVTTQQS